MRYWFVRVLVIGTKLGLKPALPTQSSKQIPTLTLAITLLIQKMRVRHVMQWRFMCALQSTSYMQVRQNSSLTETLFLSFKDVFYEF